MATNYDDVIAKHRKYLTHAQISALAKASEEYGLLNAGKRAEALLSAREQFDAGQRGLQNMGLSGAADAPATSGEVPRLVQKIQTPFDQYNRRLQDVENRQLASLGAAFAANTKRAMDEARKKREEELANRHAPAEYDKPKQREEHRIKATDRVLLEEMKEPAATPKVSKDDGSPTKEQQERRKRYFAALAAAKATGMPIPDLPGEMKRAKVESEVKSDIVKQATDPTARRLPPTLGMDPTRRAGIREAQSVVDKLTADKSAGKPVSDSDYKKALADVDIAKLTAENPWMAELFEDPGTAEKGYSNVSEPGALGGGSSYYDGLKSAAAAETEKNTAKKKEIDAALKNQREQYQHYKSLLDVIDSTGGYKEDKDRALASIKASPLTVDQARKFVSKYEELQKWAPETTANDTLYYADLQRKDPDAYKALQVYPYLPQIKERYPDLASWVEGKVADYNMQQHGFRLPTMSAEKYEENKANIKGIKAALKAVQNAQYDYDNAGAQEPDDVVSDKDHAAAALAEAKAALKNKYGMSVQDAERFIEAFERERDARSEYNYYRPGMVAQLEHSGEKPTKPVNQREADGVYRLVNGLVTNPNTHSFGGIDVSAHEYISKDQRDAYNAIYERNGIEAANEFYKSIIPYLNIQRAAADESFYKKFADEHPFWADLRSIGANLVWNIPASVENISKGIQGRFTEERPYYDVNSSASFRSGRADIIRSERSQNILSNMDRPDWANKALNFAYNTGMSIGDSAAVMALAYLGAPPAVTSVVFGSSAGNQAYKDAMERGATQNQALSYAIVNGVAEALFEKVSLEKVMTMDFTGRGALIKNLLSQSFVEGSEELATGVADLLGDLWIMQDKSQYNLAKKQYIAQGMTEYQAEMKAFLDQVKDVGMDALGGFISGAAFAGGGAVLNSAQYKVAGKKLREGNSATMDRYTRAAQILGGKSLDALQQYQAEQTDTNAGKLKAAVDDTFLDLFGNGKTGRKAEINIPDVSNASSIANAKPNPLRTDAALDVDAAKNERVIDRATAGAAMLSGDRMNTTLAKTIMDVLGDGYLRDQGYDVSSPQAFSNDYNARLDKYGIKPYVEVQTDATPKLSHQAGTLADARLRKADQAFRAESPSTEGGILAGKALQQRQQNRQQVDLKAKENAAANRVWKNPNQGYTTTADGKQVMSLPGNMTAVARAEYERKNFKAQTTAKMDGVTLELSGMEARKGLTDAQVFAEAKKAMTKEAAQKLDVYMKLSKALSLPMVIRDVVAGTSGYVHDGKLYVTLSGQQSIPRVVAHELTHFMQQHASEKYDALRTHLVADVGGKTEFDKLMREKAERYGLDLSNEAERNEADDEVCAELCERMLSDTEALERFAEKNVGAATTLRDRLLKILNAVKAALKDVKNRDFGNSKSDLITQEETIEAWYDGISEAIKNANERSQTNEGRIAQTAGVTTVDQKQMDADMRRELFLDDAALEREQLKEAAEEDAEKGTDVPGIKKTEMEQILSSALYGNKDNYGAYDYKRARSMLAQLVPDVVSALNGNTDFVEMQKRMETAVGAMLDMYFEDEGDHLALMDLIPAEIAVDTTAKGDLKYRDTTLLQMSNKLSNALGRRVTLVSSASPKAKTAMSLEELWGRAHEQFGLSDYQDFHQSTEKLLDWITSETGATRRSFSNLYGAKRANIVSDQVNKLVAAVDKMLADRVDNVIAEHSVDIIEYDMAGYHQDLMENLVSKGIMSENEIDDLFNTMMDAVRYVKFHRDILDFGFRLSEEARNDKELAEKEIKAAKEGRAYLPYKQNADPHYKLALDFSTLCKKRILLQMIQERLQGKLGRALSALETIAVRREIQKLQKNGVDVEVACALCYVEAARLKSPKVINEFLGVGLSAAERAKNVEAEMRNYFAQKDKAIKKDIEAAQKKWKVEQLGKDWVGYDKKGRKITAEKATKDDLKAFGGQALVDKFNADSKAMRTGDEIVGKSLKQNQQAIIEEAQRLVQEAPKTFLSADSLAKLKLSNPDIFYAFTNKVRSATRSKALETDTFYSRGDISMVEEAIVRAANKESGFRHQSWSDFMPIHLLDTMASIIEMSQRDAKMHAYTKVPDMVRLLGNTGMMLNLSLIPAGQTGIKDGKLDFDSIEGMDYDTMLKLRDAFPNTVGNIAIGISDEQIRMLLGSDEIDYVIPYHVSGMNKELRTHMGIHTWLDFTSHQNESVADGKAPSGRTWSEEHKARKMKPPALEAWFKEKDAKAAGKNGIGYMQKAAQDYLDICARDGWVPKFSQYLDYDAKTNKYTPKAGYENYWKMLTDRKMVNQKTGEVIIQQAVKPKFDNATVMDILRSEAEDPTAIRNAAAADEIAGELGKTWRGDKENANLKSYKDELNAFREATAVMAADRVKAEVQKKLEEQKTAEETGIRNSLDTDYMMLAEEYNPWDRATERRLDQMVKQSAVDAGYDTPMLFHGTPSFGWTVYADRNHSTPFIYTSTKSEVSAHYAGDRNYAFRRDIGQKYDGGNSLDSIIKDAKWVYQTNLRVPTDVAKANRFAADIKEATKVADKIDELWKDVSNEYPNDVSNALAGMADIFYTLRDGDVAYGKTPEEAAKSIIADKSAQKQFKQDIDWSLRYLERSREVFRDYYDEHRSDMGKAEKALFSYLMSYEVGDAAIDIQYGLGLLLDNDRVLQRVADGGFVDADKMREGMDESREIGAYKLYGNLGEKPFIFDANGGQFWALKVPEISDGYVDTDTVSKWALKNGYTSVIMKNIYDYGDKADNYVFFSPEQIKSADPVTYDDQGNIIPLSERFNAKSDDIRYSIDEDEIRQAFTVIDTAGIEDGLEALKDVKHVGAFALKDISRFLDASAGKNKDLRNTLHAIFEAPHSEATGRYARGVERMQQKVLDIGQRAGVCDAKGKHFDSKKSAAIQNIGEGFSNTYTDLKLKVKDAEHVTVQAFEPGTDKQVVPERDYTLKELRQAYGTNAADYVWDQVFHQAEDAQATGGENGWIEQKVNTRPYTLADLKKAFPNDWQQLKAAADEFRQMYDEYIRDQNNMLSTIYPIESEYADVEKLEAAIAKKEERLTRHKDAVAQQIDSLQKSLEAKEKEMAGKKRTDTKAYRQLYEQASKMTDKIAELKSEIAEYEANARDELVKMNTLKAEMQNAVQKGDYSLKRMHRLQYRSDYFHHFSEMASGIENLKSIFTNNTDIAPAIVGKSEGTKAKTKWAGYFQQRMGGDYTADALNGMLRYGQLAEYKLAFDPLTAYLRDVNKQVRDMSDDTNRDGLIRYIDQWADNIAGKSHKIDRVVSDAGMAPRKAMQILQWINSRVIQNTLLFNMRSALVQISNITNAKGIVKNNIDWANGLRSWAMAARGDEAMASIMSQSNFLASRYMDGLELTDSKLKSVKQFAGWMLGALDEISAKATWWAAYQQYTRNPHAADNQYRSYDSAVDYADDVTRRTHAGRGVGELAPAMTSKVVNFVAPFQVEVNNTWQLLKDNVKQKNFLGLLSTGVSVFLFNTVFEEIVGSTPLGFDFIRAILDIVLGFTNDDDDDDPTVKSIAQRFAGELVGGLPFGGQLVTAIGKERAKKLLGNNTDVTRYDNTQIGVTAVWNTVEGLWDIGSRLIEGRRVNWIDDIDDLLNLTLPFGGKQLTRTAQGLATVAKGYAGKYDEKGDEKVQFVTDGTILKYIHAGLFGKWALTEASEFFGEKRLLPQLFGKYEGPKSSLGTSVDAKEYKAAIATGITGKDYFTLKSDLNWYSTQDGKRAELMQKDLTPEQKAKLDALLLSDKDDVMKTEGGIVYKQDSKGEWKMKADYTSQDMFELSQMGEKIYTTTKTLIQNGFDQEMALTAAHVWDSTKDTPDEIEGVDDRKLAFRKMLFESKAYTIDQKRQLDAAFCESKNQADYTDQELFDLSVSGNYSKYEKAVEVKNQGVPIATYEKLAAKKAELTERNKQLKAAGKKSEGIASAIRQEIMNSNLTVKQKEALDDLLVSDEGRNPDYSSQAWFDLSMLNKTEYDKAKDGAKVGVKPEVYLAAYKKYKEVNRKEGDKYVYTKKEAKALLKAYMDKLPISAPAYDYIWTAVFGYKSR